MISLRDLLYKVVPIVNNTVSYAEKFGKGADFKCSYHKKIIIIDRGQEDTFGGYG